MRPHILSLSLLFLLCLSPLTGCGLQNEADSSVTSVPTYIPLSRDDATRAFTGEAIAAAVRQIRGETGEGIDTARFTQPFTIPIVRGDGSVTDDDTTWYMMAYDDERLYAYFIAFQPETEENPLVLASAAGIGTLNSLLERSVRHTGVREITLVALPDLPDITSPMCFVNSDGLVYPLFRKNPEDQEGLPVAYLPELTPQFVLPVAAHGLF